MAFSSVEDALAKAAVRYVGAGTILAEGLLRAALPPRMKWQLLAPSCARGQRSLLPEPHDSGLHIRWPLHPIIRILILYRANGPRVKNRVVKTDYRCVAPQAWARSFTFIYWRRGVIGT